MLPVLRTNTLAAPMSALRSNRLESLFDTFFGDDGGFADRAWSGTPLAMWHDDDHIYVEAELPGFSDQDVQVTVHNGMLFIRGERKPEEGRRYLYNGRSYGRLERIVSLPEAVATDGVTASLTNGVLHVTLPKSPEAKPRKISLKAE